MKKLLFILGPTPTPKHILKIGGLQASEFRNEKFSNIMKENEKMLLSLANAPKGSKAIFLASSGTGAMQSCVDNFMDRNSKAIVVNGGGFGERFLEIMQRQNFNGIDFKIDKNEQINFKKLKRYKADMLYTNGCETSTGRIYNIKKIGKFCKNNDMLFAVDAISAFLCDEIDMKKQNIDILLISSNKGLALPPGLAMIILSPNALRRLKGSANLYFDFRNYLLDMKRGQTPFTPAVTILHQLNKRLKDLAAQKMSDILKQKAFLAKYLRKNLQSLPLEPFVEEQSNAMSAFLLTDKTKASQMIYEIEKKYGVVLRNSGGALKDTMFRVSNMGEISKQDIDRLIFVLKDFYRGRR